MGHVERIREDAGAVLRRVHRQASVARRDGEAVGSIAAARSLRLQLFDGEPPPHRAGVERVSAHGEGHRRGGGRRVHRRVGVEPVLG